LTSDRRARLFFAALLCFGFARLAQAASLDPGARVLRVERWIKATFAHQPGSKDDAVTEVSLWSAAELRDLFVDESIIARLMRDPGSTKKILIPATTSARQPFPYTDWQVHRLRVLACAAGGLVRTSVCQELKAPWEIDPVLGRLSDAVEAATSRGENGFVLRRGALLHGDIAMSGPVSVMAPDTSSGQPRIRVHVDDGESTGFTAAPIHWEMARMLFDNVTPGPGDTLARDWYVATAAWMQSREQHDTVHLRHAREVFPDDPEIAFLSGCQQETYASAAIQAVVRSAVLPPGYSLDVPKEPAALRDAEAFFRRTLAQNPRHLEARLRLGHVLLARGRPQDAASELRQIVAPADEPDLRYFTAMFLGAAEEGSSRFDEARAAYENAAALFPGAQSPLLALSALATRRGDRSSALKHIQRLFDLPAVLRQPNDPWWQYRVSQARNVDALFAAMYEPFMQAPH
jgi:Flp pilus assembly protein TadD